MNIHFKNLMSLSIISIFLLGCGGSSSNKDTTAPTLEFNGDTEITIAQGSTYTEQVITSNDGTIKVEGTVDASTVGIYSLIYTAVDDAGNSAEPVTITVNVTDQTAPTLVLIGDSEITIAQGSTYTDQGALSDDGVISVVSNLDTSTIRTYTLSYYAVDAAGNSATQVTRFVNVTDQSSPVITLNGAGEVTVAQGSTYDDLGAVSNDGSIVSVDTSDVIEETIGEYTVTYSSVDDAGNVAETVSRTVNVTDQNAPVITLNGADEVTIAQGSTYDDLGAESDDGSNVNVDSSDVIEETIGEYIVTYSATDDAGNIAESITRTIFVTDQTAPVIQLNGDAEVTVVQGMNYEELGAESDDGTVVLVDGVDNVNTSVMDVYEITYTAIDDAGNQAEPVVRSVSVLDDPIAPVISLKGEAITQVILGDEYIDAGADLDDENLGVSHLTADNLDIVITSKVGSYILKYNSTDAAGNDAIEVTRLVEVRPDKLYSFHGELFDYYLLMEETVSTEFDFTVEDKVNLNEYKFSGSQFYPYGSPYFSGPYYSDRGGYYLKDGNWESTLGLHDISWTTTGFTMYDGTFVISVSSEDISNQEIDTDLYPFYVYKEEGVMPVGSKRISFEMNFAREHYQLHEKALNYDIVDEDGFPMPEVFTSLEGYQNYQCNLGTSLDTRVNDDETRTFLYLGCSEDGAMSGTLTGKTGVWNNYQEIDNAGTWEIKDIPNTTTQAIIITTSSGFWQNNTSSEAFIALKDGEVWKGEHTKISEEIISLPPLFNKVVFDALEPLLYQ